MARRGLRLLACAFALSLLTHPPLATAVPATLAEPVDTIAQRVAPCVACHGEQGRGQTGGYYPRLAGKPAGYLFNQLLNFQQGRRQHAVMIYLVERQRPEYLREMAEYFAAQNLEYGASSAQQIPEHLLAQGRALVERGRPQADVPSCISCHGEELLGAGEVIPGLLGLPRDYISAQLGAWQAGLRKAQTPDCMGTIARRLSVADIAAVSAYLTTRSAPAEAKAGPLPQRLPMPCGGVPDAGGRP